MGCGLWRCLKDWGWDGPRAGEGCQTGRSHVPTPTVPGDRWIGWKPDPPYDRLDRMANTTRFRVLSRNSTKQHGAGCTAERRRVLSAADDLEDPGVLRRMGLHALAARTGHAVLAETFCDPTHFPGTMYTASNGTHRGPMGDRCGLFPGERDLYTDPHGIRLTPCKR